jgi:sugar phosphate isomerase/epimerase
MKIGIGTYALAWSIGVPGFKPSDPVNIFQFLEYVHNHGVSLVQIADNLPLHMYTDVELNTINNLSKKLGIEVEVGTRGLMPENIRRYLEIASLFKSPILRVVIDSKDFTPDMDEINRIIEGLSPELQQRNIKLAIENHDRLKADQFRNIVKNADTDLIGICLDSVNSIGADEGFELVFETLAPYTINLHLKDYIIRRKRHMMGFDIYGTPAGQGMMPIKRVLETLKNYGKTKSVILELWPPPEDDILGTIIKEKRWVKESIEYLSSIAI